MVGDAYESDKGFLEYLVSKEFDLNEQVMHTNLYTHGWHECTHSHALAHTCTHILNHVRTHTHTGQVPQIGVDHRHRQGHDGRS